MSSSPPPKLEGIDLATQVPMTTSESWSTTSWFAREKEVTSESETAMRSVPCSNERRGFPATGSNACFTRVSPTQSTSWMPLAGLEQPVLV